MDPPGMLAELLARLLCGGHRAGHSAGEVDRDDLVALLEQRPVDRQEVADRGLGGGW